MIVQIVTSFVSSNITMNISKRSYFLINVQIYRWLIKNELFAHNNFRNILVNLKNRLNLKWHVFSNEKNKSTILHILRNQQFSPTISNYSRTGTLERRPSFSKVCEKRKPVSGREEKYRGDSNFARASRKRRQKNPFSNPFEFRETSLIGGWEGGCDRSEWKLFVPFPRFCWRFPAPKTTRLTTDTAVIVTTH